jgi:hypothetical protein
MKSREFVIASTTDTQEALDFAAGIAKRPEGTSAFTVAAEILRTEGQEESHREAEVKYLDGAEDQRDYKVRRCNQVVDTDSPLDEIPYRDYCFRRAEGEK